MDHCLAPRLFLLAVLHAHMTGFKNLRGRGGGDHSPAGGGTSKRYVVNISLVTKIEKKTY